MKKNLTLLLCVWIFTAGCAAKVSSKWDGVTADNPSVALSVPFYDQQDYFCGPASLAMMLEYSGIKSNPDEIAQKVFTPSRKGSFKEDMLTGTRRSGRIPYTIDSPQDLYGFLRTGRPVLVFLNLGLDIYPVWHYAVVTGIDGGYITIHSGDTPDEKVKTSVFDRIWSRAGYWGFVLLKPGEVPDGIDPVRLSEAASAYALSDASGAIKTLSYAYELFDSKPVMFSYATALYISGRKTESIDIFRRITEKYPDDGDGWNNLAHVLNETGLGKLALYAARRAVAIGGKNLDIYQETLDSIQTP